MSRRARRTGGGRPAAAGSDEARADDPRADAPPATEAGAPGTYGLRGTVAQLWWGALAGTLIFLSFPFRTVPASNLWPLAWVALVPWLWAQEGVSGRRGFWLGWWVGFVTNFGGFHWIAQLLMEFGELPPWAAWPVAGLNAAYQGLVFGLIGWAWARLRPRGGRPMSAFRVAMIFTALEFLFPMIFPWFLGNSQYRFLAAEQIADVTGVGGVTFTLVLFNAALWRLARGLAGREPVPLRHLAVAGAVVGGVLVYGVVRLGQVEDAMAQAEKLKVGVVEADVGIWQTERKAHPDVDPRALRRAHLLRHQRLSADLQARGAELIVWPESSYLPTSAAYVKRLDDFALGVSARGQIVAWRDGAPPGSATPTMRWVVLDEHPDRRLRAVAAAREDAVAAVGDGGLAVVGDGRRFVPAATSTSEDLHAVAAVTADGTPRSDGGAVSIWAAGARGTLLRGVLGNGHGAPDVRLDRVSSGTTRDLHGLAMVTASEGVAVGDAGTIVSIGGGEATVLRAPTSENLYAAWTAERGADLWIVGAGGTILHADGRGFTPEDSHTERSLRAVTGVAPGGDDGRGDGLVLAVGDGGTIVRRVPPGPGRAARWQPEAIDTTEDLVAVTVDARGQALVSTRGGAVWRRETPTTRPGGPGLAPDTPVTWRRVETAGIEPLGGLARSPYTRTFALPRDTRYVYQSPAPLPPNEASYWKNPAPELALPDRDRTAAQRGFDAPVLFGAVTWALNPKRDATHPLLQYNTAVMLDRRGAVVGTYDKVYLLVFGEYIPLGERFPVFYEWIRNAGRFEAGRDVKVFEWPRPGGNATRLGVMICYEDILPKFTRRLAAQEPNLILNVTNDAWFGKTAEPYLHMALATMRAVENRKALIRSTNTGVSVVVEPTGEIVARTSLEDSETLLEDVPLMDGAPTVYGQLGDAFQYALLVWLGALLVGLVLGRERAPTGNHRVA